MDDNKLRTRFRRALEADDDRLDYWNVRRPRIRRGPERGVDWEVIATVQSTSEVVAFYEGKLTGSSACLPDAFGALVSEYARDVARTLYMAAKACESPIEEALLAAMVAVCTRSGDVVELREGVVDGYGALLGWLRHAFADETSRFVITQQAHVLGCRVDFLVEFWQDDKVAARIVVECDGHEFHERTKAQAARDRNRDRKFQKAGYLAYRFTGSQIWDDAIGCAREVFSTLIDRSLANEDVAPSGPDF